MRISLKRKKNDIAEGFLNGWAEYQQEERNASKELERDLIGVIEYKGLLKLVVSVLTKKRYRKIPEGGMVLSSGQVKEFAQLKMLNVDSLNDFYKRDNDKAVKQVLEDVRKYLQQLHSEWFLMTDEQRCDKGNEKVHNYVLKALDDLEKYSISMGINSISDNIEKS